jgi:hypothetical protein
MDGKQQPIGCACSRKQEDTRMAAADQTWMMDVQYNMNTHRRCFNGKKFEEEKSCDKKGPKRLEAPKKNQQAGPA